MVFQFPTIPPGHNYLVMVPTEGLEPPRLTPPVSKTGVATNYTTWASSQDLVEGDGICTITELTAVLQTVGFTLTQPFLELIVYFSKN